MIQFKCQNWSKINGIWPYEPNVLASTLDSEGQIHRFCISFNILGDAAFNSFIWAFLCQLLGCAHSVHAVNSSVHAGTEGVEGQIWWFWNPFIIIGGVAFDFFVIEALLGKIQVRAHSVHIVNSSVHASTEGVEGQIWKFWVPLNIIGGAAFEFFLIWVLLGHLETCS